MQIKYVAGIFVKTFTYILRSQKMYCTMNLPKKCCLNTDLLIMEKTLTRTEDEILRFIVILMPETELFY